MKPMSNRVLSFLMLMTALAAVSLRCSVNDAQRAIRRLEYTNDRQRDALGQIISCMQTPETTDNAVCPKSEKHR